MPTRPRRPSYGGSDVSRQFTQVERGIDDNLTGLLQQPPPDIYIGDSMGESYKWLKDDLELRSNVRKDMEDTQTMAFEQGNRQELNRQALQNEEDDRAAQDAFGKLRDKVAGGTPMKDAIADLTLNTPGLPTNRSWLDGAASMSEYHLDSPDRQLRDSKIDLDLLKVGQDKFDLELFRDNVMRNPEMTRALIDKMEQDTLAGGVTAKNQKTQADLIAMKKAQEVHDAEAFRDDLQREHSQLSQDPEVRSKQLGQLAKVQDSFNQVGLQDVEDTDAVVREFSGSPEVLDALTDQAFLTRIGDGPRAELAKALNTHVRPLPANMSDPDRDRVMQERRTARNIILSVAGRYNRENGAEKLAKAQTVALKAAGKEVADAYTGAIKDLRKSTEAPPYGGAAPPSGPIAAAESFITELESRFPDLVSSDAAKDLRTELANKTKDVTDVNVSARESQKVMDKAVKQLNETRRASLTQAKTADGKEEKDKKVPASGVKPPTGNAANPKNLPMPKSKEEADALTPGTRYIGPDGKEAVR